MINEDKFAQLRRLNFKVDNIQSFLDISDEEMNEVERRIREELAKNKKKPKKNSNPDFRENEFSQQRP